MDCRGKLFVMVLYFDFLLDWLTDFDGRTDGLLPARDKSVFVRTDGSLEASRGMMMMMMTRMAA